MPQRPAEPSPDEGIDGNEHDANSPAYDQGIQDRIPDIIESLPARGKGHYTCLYGTDCTKGGLQADRDVVIFERNSAFR